MGCLLETRPSSAAAASLLQLDAPLLPSAVLEGDAATAAGSLLEQLQVLAAGCEVATDRPQGAAPTGFVSLTDLPALCGQAAAGAGPAPAEPARPEAASHLSQFLPVRLAEPPQRPALPSFLLRTALGQSTPQPAAAAASVAEGSGVAGGQAAGMGALFTLDVPVLPCLASADFAAGPALGAPACAFPQLFQPVAVPEVTLHPTFVPAGCKPVSLEALMAQDLVLEDDCLVLPPVILEARAGEAEAQAGESTRCGCCQRAFPGMQQQDTAASETAEYARLIMCQAVCLQALRSCPSFGRAAAAGKPAQRTPRCTWTGEQQISCCSRLPVVCEEA